jgi:formylglycine-generating enzyme required for sulfatase activity
MKTITFVLLFVFILGACGPAPTPTATPIPPTATVPPPTATPPLAIGSKRVSPVDGMVQIYVPAGNFLMGETEAEVAQALNTCYACNYNNEKPQHTVNVDAFWMDQTLVTNAMYAQCVQAGKCQPPSDKTSNSREIYYGDSVYDHYPVINLAWDDATAYCKWAGRRLPTEAEWEKAARGTDGRQYPWGNQEPSPTLGTLGPWGDTAGVGIHPAAASPYGALDMVGNVEQWVNDWYDANYYSTSPLSNPPGPATGDSRVLRGGLLGPDHHYSPRVADRDNDSPAAQELYVGFRCAATPGK